jgi:PAS domain S-box-containing protein
MTKIKGSGLLIRISHLIFIQILFIFAALALVLFYPQDADSPTSNLADLEQKTALFVSRVAEVLSNDMSGTMLDSMTIQGIENMARKNSLILSLELYSVSNKKATSNLLSYYAVSKTDFESDSHTEEFIGSLTEQLSRSNRRNLTFWTPDGKFIKHIFARSTSDDEYLAVIRTGNIQYAEIENGSGYLLLLLFLISTLISLLIIHLIAMGIRKPLDRLIAAFDETASGKMTIIPDNQGDKGIRKLAQAFNRMSSDLNQQQNRLTQANKELMRVNKSLVESESILTALVDYSPDAILVTDLEDQILIYNQAAAREFGYDQCSMIGKNISNLLPVSKIKSEFSLASQDDWEGKEIICRRRDGSRFPAMLVHTPLGPERNKPIALLYFIKNIAESEKYQDMILRLDRIASRGKMARDIAHEINNYLAVLQGNLELLPIFIAGNDPGKTNSKIELMKNTVKNITTFTEGLSRYSDETSEFGKEDLNQLIENLLAFVKPQNKFDNIVIGTNLSEDLPMVEIDPTQIQHLIVNLLSNAAEAQIRTDDNKWIAISTSLDKTKKYFIIKIADGGPGLDEAYLDRLFIGRFSTKREGTGLGLITCKNIVNNHLGEISYHSSDESKAIFVIKIPVSHSEMVDNDDIISTVSERVIPG